MSLADWLQILTWRDFLDIALVALVIYNLLLLIRGTRAVQILLGILFIAAASYLAGVANLITLQQLLGNFLLVLPLAIIVLFQHEIRHALASFGRNPLWGLGTHQQVESTISEIVTAATTLSDRRIGALIVIQRLEGLRNYIENGVEIDARVSYDLLINLFSPETPLHDGAAIIQQDRIAAAACFLPLSLNPEISKDHGTRHRAALGISEEADALAVVVSEETGNISLAIGGELIRDLDSKSLRNALYKYLITDLGSLSEKSS
jgi:diadenylate cyclase